MQARTCVQIKLEPARRGGIRSVNMRIYIVRLAAAAVLVMWMGGCGGGDGGTPQIDAPPGGADASVHPDSNPNMPDANTVTTPDAPLPTPDAPFSCTMDAFLTCSDGDTALFCNSTGTGTVPMPCGGNG